MILMISEQRQNLANSDRYTNAWWLRTLR